MASMVLLMTRRGSRLMVSGHFSPTARIYGSLARRRRSSMVGSGVY